MRQFSRELFSRPTGNILNCVVVIVTVYRPWIHTLSPCHQSLPLATVLFPSRSSFTPASWSWERTPIKPTLHWGEVQIKNCLMKSVKRIKWRLMLFWDRAVEIYNMPSWCLPPVYISISNLAYFFETCIWSAMLNLYHIFTGISIRYAI